MSERRWTDEQLSAIETRDRTLLVSAAAGSGKTATLTERIIRSLTDEKNPVEINSLLVVTFTNAAARELRAKISSALEAAVMKDPGNEYLQKQLYMLPVAKIRTIDSFCNDILRANADRVGVPQGYRIADSAEIALLASSILEGLIESVYDGKEPDIATADEFEELADCLTDSKRTEELSAVLDFVRARCDSCETGIDALAPLIEKFNPEKFEKVEKTYHGAYLMGCLFELLDHYIDKLSVFEKDFSFGTEGELIYAAMVSADKNILTSLRQAGDYLGVRDLICNLKFSTRPTIKKDKKTERMEDYATLRDIMKSELSDFTDFFLYSEEQWRELYSSLYRLLTVLYKFEKKYESIFLSEKIQRGALSYGDIERLCYNCLIENGERTDIAKNLEKQFDAIYIDEYQDVNSLQNEIFKAISKPDNRFMVGDIKQSIYGFRSARPEIFAEMKSKFAPLSEKYTEQASIFMSKNFRCDKGVVDFVNGVFDKVFSLIGENIGYAHGDRLGYAKIHKDGEPEYKKPVVCMIDKSAEIDEPALVAEKIAEILREGRLDSGEAVRPSDIAIIMRYTSGKDFLYADALRERGIPSMISGAQDFFLSPEVLLALCLLNSIDNPNRDIYLAGLMCSPLFSFDADDLYNIRREAADTLYLSLRAYTEKNPEFEKGARFLNELDHYRAIAEGVGVDNLLYRLYYETGLMALASANGGAENLTLLYDYARNFEAGAFRGLYNFINFVNNLIDKDTTFDDNRDGGDSDAVKIVTCHASKGLEYPIVFLVETGKKFTNRDARGRLVMDENFGISFLLRTKSRTALVNNPVQDLTNHYIFRKSFEEELRVLYVALTRAREQLFVTGVCPTVKREEYERRLEILRETLSSYSVRTLSSTEEIMMVCGEGSGAVAEDEFLTANGERAEKNADFPEENIAKNAEKSKEIEENGNEFLFDFADDFDLGLSVEGEGFVDTDELVSRFSFEYPYKYVTDLPEKMSVSRITPTVLDGVPEGVQLYSATDESEEQTRVLPRFAEGRPYEESARRGIATHYFMQFCDLENLAVRGAESELFRLVSEGFLSSADGERVRLGEIKKFEKSKLFSDMRGAKRIWREFRFNTLFDAEDFTSEEQRKLAYRGRRVLVQGVIDCIVEYHDGKIGLFDYKTDRLSREELSDRALAESNLKQKHSSQLCLYARAIERIFGRYPDKIEVYSLPLGDTVNVGQIDRKD